MNFYKQKQPRKELQFVTASVSPFDNFCLHFRRMCLTTAVQI